MLPDDQSGSMNTVLYNIHQLFHDRMNRNDRMNHLSWITIPLSVVKLL